MQFKFYIYKRVRMVGETGVYRERKVFSFEIEADAKAYWTKIQSRWNSTDHRGRLVHNFEPNPDDDGRSDINFSCGRIWSE